MYNNFLTSFLSTLKFHKKNNNNNIKKNCQYQLINVSGFYIMIYYDLSIGQSLRSYELLKSFASDL